MGHMLLKRLLTMVWEDTKERDMKKLIGIVVMTGLLASGCRPLGLPAPPVPETAATTTTSTTSPPSTPVPQNVSAQTPAEAPPIDVEPTELDELMTELDAVLSEVDDAFSQGEEQ